MEYNLIGILKSVEAKQICIIGDMDTVNKLKNIGIKVYGNIFYVKCNGSLIPPDYDGKRVKLRVSKKKNIYLRLVSVKHW